jgi:secondary thiamine-phosphate synthase enzyme
MLTQASHNLEISTRGAGLYEFTSTISEWVGRQKMRTGLLTVFCRHTSASLLIQENADPTVRETSKTISTGSHLRMGHTITTLKGPTICPLI